MPGTLFARVNCEAFDILRKKIRKEDAVEEGPKWCKGGIETDSHCTMYYGIPDTESMKNIAGDLRRFCLRHPSMAFIPGKAGVFEADGWDCLVVHALEDGSRTSQLKKFNDNFQRVFKYEGSEYDYNPHVTIVYLKVGKGKKYVDMFNDSIFAGRRVMPITEVVACVGEPEVKAVFRLSSSLGGVEGYYGKERA